MSISDLANIISPAFTENTVLDILKKKTSGLSDPQNVEIDIDNASSKKGDSYLSSICRFTVKASGTNTEGTSESISLPVIVKFFPKNPTRQNTFRSADFFKTEIEFYEKVWPEMKKIKLAKSSDKPDEIPLLLASHCDGKNDFIALEDLSYQGFKPPGRSEEVTKERLSLFLETLANFHALGMVAREKNPEFERIASSITESYFADKYRPWYETWMYKSMVPRFQTAVKLVLPQEYHDKVTQLFSGDLYGEYIKGCTLRNKLCSVTEGDAWLPNFLVATDKDGHSTAVLIDFQLARYAPVTNDLLHFLYCCVPSPILVEHWDDLITEYHQFLTKRIEELGGGTNYITLKELNEGILRHPMVGLGMGMESTIMAILTDDEVCELDSLKGENNIVPLEDVWILPEFDRPRNEKLAFLIKHFVDKGLI